jgi:excisionase family DNA binding protein
MNPGYLTKKQAAEYGGCGQRTIDRWRSNGDLPFYRLGARKVLFKAADIDAYLQRFRVDVGAAQ